MTKEEVEQTFNGLSPYYAYKQGLQDGIAYNEESFRREAAKDILCAMIQAGVDDAWKNVVPAAIEGADELIAYFRENKDHKK